MSLLRPCVDAMTPYVPGKQPPAGARVIKLNTNENPYPPSPEVARAVTRELEAGGDRLRRYSDPGATALRRAVADVTGFPVEGILAGNGSDELLALLLRATVDPGAVVAYPEPTYVLYETLAAAQDAVVRTVPFGPDFSLPEELFNLPARVVFVASPNSPSGNAHPARSLERLARGLGDGLLVVDEAYADFASESALELARRLPNVVVTRTLSKSYSLAGLRVGFLFGSPEVVHGLTKIKDSYNLDRLALAAAEAAVIDQAWMRANVARVRATRSRMTDALRALGLDVLPSEANFVLARLGSAERARRAHAGLEARGILVRYFDRPGLDDALHAGLEARGILVRYFDRPGLDDALRISVGSDEETTAFLTALEAELSAPAT
jgi:histidinol-phosphate aminotransferase